MSAPSLPAVQSYSSYALADSINAAATSTFLSGVLIGNSFPGFLIEHSVPAASTCSRRHTVAVNAKNLPTLHDKALREVRIISPRFRDSFRIQEGVAAAPRDIERWQILHIT